MICAISSNDKRKRHDSDKLDKLICSMASGSTDALAEIYEETKTSVYSFIFSILRNTHDAEDVMHDCYIRLYYASQDYRRMGNPMSWILTIAKNLSLRKIHDGNRTVSENADSSTEGSIGGSADDFTRETDDRITAMQCMEKLSDAERSIVTLHAVSGLKHREIAEIMDMPLSTVLSKYNRAMKKLRELLK